MKNMRYTYKRKVLETISYHRNSDDFIFDTEFLAQAVHHGFRFGDIPIPTRYFPEASSLSLGTAYRERSSPAPVRIGSVVVDANSLVLSNLPENAVAVVPARVLSYTGSDKLIRLPET
jgi:hypothetical protein